MYGAVSGAPARFRAVAGYQVEVYLRDGRRIDSPTLNRSDANQEFAALGEVVGAPGKVERPWIVVDRGDSISAVALYEEP